MAYLCLALAALVARLLRTPVFQGGRRTEEDARALGPWEGAGAVVVVFGAPGDIVGDEVPAVLRSESDIEGGLGKKIYRGAWQGGGGGRAARARA